VSTIATITLKGIDTLIESHGESPEALIVEAGLDPKLLERPDTLIDGQVFCDLIELSARRLNQRFFGLQLARIQGASILGPLWFYLRNSATLREAITKLQENFLAHTEVTYWREHHTKKGIIVAYDINPKIKGNTDQVIELGLCILVDSLRISLGPSWQPSSVYLKCSNPYASQPLTNVFGHNIYFGQEINGILLTQEELESRVTGSSFLGHQHYQSVLQRKSDFNAHSVVTQAENIIHTSITRHICSQSFVAKSLGISTRSLRHYLKVGGTNYQEIVTSAKLKLAIDYLTLSQLKISEIAERLQFSETSVFSRFVKKHTGKTPRDIKANSSIQHVD